MDAKRDTVSEKSGASDGYAQRLVGPSFYRSNPAITDKCQARQFVRFGRLSGQADLGQIVTWS